MPNSNQVAAIPVRRRDDGNLEVLLVTSRETRRWIVPKGWPWPEVSDHEAAAAEAWEEAGVRGRILADGLGTYTYDKQRDGTLLSVDVKLSWWRVAPNSGTQAKRLSSNVRSTHWRLRLQM